MDSPECREGSTVLASPPKTDVRSAPLTRTLPFPMYRTFMAHKYQELSMISLLYYQETLTADRGTPGDQNCYLAQFYIACPTPTGYREFQRNNCRCDAGLPPIRPRKRHSIRRSAQALYIARVPNSIYRPVYPFLRKRKAKTIASYIQVLAVPASRMEL